MTAVEYILNLVVGEDEQGKDVRVKDTINKSEIKQAKEREKEQKIEFACAVYDKYNFGQQEISFRGECEQFKSE